MKQPKIIDPDDWLTTKSTLKDQNLRKSAEKYKKMTTSRRKEISEQYPEEIKANAKDIQIMQENEYNMKNFLLNDQQ